MMFRSLLPLLAFIPFVPAPANGPLDVSRLTIGAATTIAELDLGKLKGELRRLSWAPDGAQLCVMTADNDMPDAKLHFYTVPLGGGAVTPADREPEWATEYWTVK